MCSLERLRRDRPEPQSPILQVGVVLSKLLNRGNYTPSRFQTVADWMAEADNEKHRRLDTTLDQLRARYGKKVVYFGNVQECRDDAPMRISFTHIPEVTLEKD
jgi:DNA polymerase IV